jgi:hypothetical protein
MCSRARQLSFNRWAPWLLLAALTGCGRDEVQVYQVAKEAEPPAAQPAAMPPGHPDTGGGGSGGGTPKLQWKLPAGWEEAPPGEMRAASFRVKGADGKQAEVSVVPLPGLAGSDLDNVNRWRGQVGLAPVSEAELSKLAQPVEVGGQAAQLYEQAGQNPGSGEATRILAAVLRREGVAWFFKMTGEDGLVAQQKPVFVDFLKSISFPAAVAQSELPPSHPPVGDMSMMGGAGGASASSGGPKPTWQVPAGWKEVPGGQFLVAKFTLSGADNAAAAVNVSMSPGDGGGLVANVNRWRGQLGLGQLSDEEVRKLVTPLDLAGGKAMLVDMTGTDPRSGQQARLVGALVPQPDQTWFYKLMGNAQVVGREKDAFTTFVQTAKY